MTEVDQQEILSRRGFMKALAATAVAATATGAGAALLTNRPPASAPAPAVALPRVPAVETVGRVVEANQDVAQLMARLASAQAENVRLQAALDAAERQLDGRQTSESEGRSENETLRTELAASTEQVGLLAGLVALYEQLDEADVPGVVEDGLQAMGDSVDTLLAELPDLSDGVALGRAALDEVEAHLPLLAEGREWLGERLETLEAYYGLVELVLQNALEQAAPFLVMIGEWFQQVRKWLPFGLGERAAEVVEALTTLVGVTPDTVIGLNDRVAQPLDNWLAPEDQAPRLHARLIKPVREEVLARAEDTVSKAQDVQAAYARDLATPVANIAHQRRQLREQIRRYRAQHTL